MKQSLKNVYTKRHLSGSYWRMCSSNDTVNQGKDKQNKEEGPTKQEFPGDGERNISATSLEQDWRVTG